MQKLNKLRENTFSANYQSWWEKQVNENRFNGKDSNQYYLDIALDLFRIQRGVCAYTEMFLCCPENYNPDFWKAGRYTNDSRPEFFGELDHFDPKDKQSRYWNWDNLFMIHDTINSKKTNKEVIPYLKPDTSNYFPENYLDFDTVTCRFIPNSELEGTKEYDEVKNMIDNVLLLNHQTVLYERKNYLMDLKDRKSRGEEPIIDRFFTAVDMSF